MKVLNTKEVFEKYGINRHMLRYYYNHKLLYPFKSGKRGTSNLYRDGDIVELLHSLQLQKKNKLKIKEKIKEDYLVHGDASQLVVKYKLSKPTILIYLKEIGVYELPYKFPKEIKQKIIDDYEKGLPPFILREKYDVSLTHLKRIIKNLNKENQLSLSWKELWKKYLDDDEYHEKMLELRKTQSINSSGKNNPMYGKPSPMGSGNGWKGWYKGWFFRSLRELSYMVKVIEKYSMDWESAEKKELAIEYVDYDGKVRNYFADFLLNKKYLIEIKPKSLWNSPRVSLKTSAAKVFCKKKSLTYKIRDVNVIDINKITNLIKQGNLEFMNKYKLKFEEYKNGQA